MGEAQAPIRPSTLSSERGAPPYDDGLRDVTAPHVPGIVHQDSRHMHDNSTPDSTGSFIQDGERVRDRLRPRGGRSNRNVGGAAQCSSDSSSYVPQTFETSFQEAASGHSGVYGRSRGRGRGTHSRAQHGRFNGGSSGSWQSSADRPLHASEASRSGTHNSRPVFDNESQSVQHLGHPSITTSNVDAAAPKESNREPHRQYADGTSFDIGSDAGTSIPWGRNARDPARSVDPPRRRGGSGGRGRSMGSSTGRGVLDTSAEPETDFVRPRGRRGGARGGGRGRVLPSQFSVGNSSVIDQITTLGSQGKHPKGAAKVVSGGSGSDSEGETLICVICCEEVAAVAVGSCGHSHTCAKCCLRLRLCYRDLRCPLCKAVNQEVVVVRPPLPSGITFESLTGSPQQREALWQQPKWAKGVLVCDSPLQSGDHTLQQGRQQHGASRRRTLHKALQAMTSLSCSVCDPPGHYPYGTMNLLLKHLRSAHNAVLCDVCLGAALKFPLEYRSYDSAGLAAHMALEHPRCEYCKLSFYGPDELYSHMTQRHFTCHVCSRLGRHQLYFLDADTLLVHMREEHHACDHPDCFGCMIAFATRDELTAHIRDRHSLHMPRWEQSRARPLLLDFITPHGPAAAAVTSGRSDRNDRLGRGQGLDMPSDRVGANVTQNSASSQRRDQAGASRLRDPDAFPALQSQAPVRSQPPAQQRQAGLAEVRDAEGGLVVIDDDLGMGPIRGSSGTASRASGAGGQAGRLMGTADAAGSQTAGTGARLAGAWAGRQPGSGTFREEFPELSTSALSTGAAPRTAWGHGGLCPTDPSRPSPSSPEPMATAASLLTLRKVTVRCPCGNRVDHLALRPDEKPPQMSCDRNCVAKQRRAQLADAFGVEAADSHVPYFDRHRTPHYTAELILAAQAAGIAWLASVERDLARFLADPSTRRTSLAAGMSQAQRKLVHELAEEHYGLASHSIGQGAARAVQLLKGASSGVPTRLLSAVVAATAPEELTRLAAGSGGASTGRWVIKLVDVTAGTDVHKYLWAWDGEYTLAQVPGSLFAVRLTFNRESAFRDCCSRLGGGIRGVFRVIVEREEVSEGLPATLAFESKGAPGGPKPAATAATPPGWQVLRGKVAAPAAHRNSANRGSVTADPASSVRSALAADAWASDDDGPLKVSSHSSTGAQEGFRDGSGMNGSGSAAKAAGEPFLPGRRPPLKLPLATPWFALSSEKADGSSEEDGATNWRVDDQGAGTMQLMANKDSFMQERWDDFEEINRDAQ